MRQSVAFIPLMPCLHGDVVCVYFDTKIVLRFMFDYIFGWYWLKLYRSNTCMNQTHLAEYQLTACRHLANFALLGGGDWVEAFLFATTTDLLWSLWNIFLKRQGSCFVTVNYDINKFDVAASVHNEFHMSLCRHFFFIWFQRISIFCVHVHIWNSVLVNTL